MYCVQLNQRLLVVISLKLILAQKVSNVIATTKAIYGICVDPHNSNRIASFADVSLFCLFVCCLVDLFIYLSIEGPTSNHYQ